MGDRDGVGQQPFVGGLVGGWKDAGMGVVLFVDSGASQQGACRATGARWVELHTGAYAEASWSLQPAELARLTEGSFIARSLGLRVNAGHGLPSQNVEPIAALEGMEELNIRPLHTCYAYHQ